MQALQQQIKIRFKGNLSCNANQDKSASLSKLAKLAKLDEANLDDLADLDELAKHSSDLDVVQTTTTTTTTIQKKRPILINNLEDRDLVCVPITQPTKKTRQPDFDDSIFINNYGEELCELSLKDIANESNIIYFKPLRPIGNEEISGFVYIL